MTPWQLLRASRANQAALGYRLHHGPGRPLHFSTAVAVAAAAVTPDCSRSFCLSREKDTLQQLNSRLASYLQQVQCLEAANHKLQCQIQRELDRKCPRELKELDGHLRTVSLLQDQISECLSAQAQVKLQLLNAELDVYDLNVRCENESERRGGLEVELNNLRLQEEELVHRLPELQSLLNNQTQQLRELQMQHQQDMRGLLAQMSGGISVEMQPTESFDLIQQLDNLRQMSEMTIDKNQNEHWFNTQVSMLSSPAVTYESGSEVIQAELGVLRRRAASLEEELTQLQALKVVLEDTGLVQNKCFVRQLEVLQQREDSLCRDLDSLLQTVAQQAADHQTLLDVKTRIETEIEDYRRLLDGLRSQSISSLHPNSAVNVRPFCVTTSPSAFRRNITVDKTISVLGGNLTTMEAQPASGRNIHTVRQTPVVAPVSGTVTTVKPTTVHSKHPKNSLLTLINTSDLTGSFHKSENQRTGTLPERTEIESMTITTMVNKQSSPVEDKVHTEDLQNSSTVTTQISKGLDEGAIVKASKVETNTGRTIMLVPDTQSVKSATVQAKPETFTSEPTIKDSVLQTNKTETHIQTVITQTILCAEPDVQQGPHVITHTTTTDPRKPASAEVKTETETVISAQMNCSEGSIQAENQDPVEVVSLRLETPTEGVGDAEDVAITASTASSVSGSHIVRSEEAQRKISGYLALMDDKHLDRKEKKDEKEGDSTSHVLNLDQSSTLSHASSTKQNKIILDADTGSDITTASSCSQDSNDNRESKTAEGIITLVSDTQSVKSAAVKERTETFTSKQTITDSGLQANKTETNIQTVITQTILCAEPDVQQGPHVITHTTTTDPRKPASAEVKTETKTVISAQMNCSEGSIQAEKQDPVEVVSLRLETPTEGVRDAEQVAITASTASSVSGSHIVRSEEAQRKISGYLALMDDKHLDRKEKKDEKEVKDTSHVLNSSSAEQNKVILDADAGSGITTASSNNLESKTAEGIITLAPDTQPAKSTAAQEKTETSTSRQSITDSGLQPDKTETIIQTVITTQDDQLESKTAGTEILKKVELEVNQGKVANSFHDTNQVKVESDNETKSTCLTDSGVAVKAEALMSMTDQLLAEKEKQLNSGGQDKDTGSIADNKEVQKPDGSPEGKYEEQKETSSIDREVMGQKKSDCQVPNMPGDSKRVLNECVKSASFGNVPAKEGTTFSVVASNSEGMATSNSGVASDMAARFGGTAANSSSTVNGNAEAASIAGTKGRIRHDSREQIVYGGSPEAKKPHQGPNTGSKEIPSEATLPTTSKKEKGRFSSGGSGEWIVYGVGIGRKSSLDGSTSLPSERKEEGHSAATNSARESGSRGNGLEQKSSLSRTRSEESPPETMPSSTSPQEIRKFGSRGSGEWRVYGGSTGRISSCARSSSLPNVEKEEEAKQTSPSGSLGTGRFSSAGSGEWRVYGGSSGRLSSASSADRVSVSASHNKMMSPTSSHKSSGSRLGSAGSGDRLNSSKVVKRSSSVGSGGQLSSSGSGGRLSNSSGSLRISSEWKPVYSSANARKSSIGSAGRLSGGGTISSQKTSSPGGRMIVNIGSSGWLNSPAAGGNSPGSGSKISTAGGTDRISTRAGGRISNSSGSGRTNSMGGRVISSSDRPIRSTGSGAGGTKERISVCKMAALSISAAGRERSQDKKEKTQPTRQKQQTGGTSPLLQRWLTTGIKVKSANPDGAK